MKMVQGHYGKGDFSRIALLFALTNICNIYFSASLFAQNNSGTAAQAPLKPDPSALVYKPDPISTTAQPLVGKLFFTDEKRGQLDNARKNGVPVIDGEVVQPSTVFTGFVKRNDGSTTYWVNAGKTETRYVIAQPGGVTVTSAMVGAEPKFVLTGTNEGVGGTSDDAKANDKAGASTKKAVRKKHTNQPKSKMLVR